MVVPHLSIINYGPRGVGAGIYRDPACAVLFPSSNYYYCVGVVSWRQLLDSGLVDASQLQSAACEV